MAVPEARRAPSPRPVQDDDPAALPVPRRRGEACKTALGAGGLVVAGSVLGAALLAAAGVGGALPVPQGDDGTGQFQGQGTLRTPGTAYGSVNGRHVVSGAGLVRAVNYYLPFTRSAAPTAAPRTVARPAVLPASAPVARAAVPAQALAPVAVPASGNPGAGLAPVVGQVTQPVAPVTRVDVAPVTGAVGPSLGGVTQTVTPIVDTVAPVVGGVDADRQAGDPGPRSGRHPGRGGGRTRRGRGGGHRAARRGAAAPVVGSVAAPLVRAAAPILDPVLQATAPVVDAVAPASAPILAAAAPVTGPVLAATQPAVGQVLDAAGPGLAAVGSARAAPAGPRRTDRDAGRCHRAAAGRRVGAADAGHPDGAVHDGRRHLPLQDATASAGSVVEGATGSVGAATDAVAPSGLRAADLPTMRLPIVGEARTPLVADDSPTAPLRIVPQTDEPGPSVDSPTLPLRIVQPSRPDTDGAPTDDVRSDGAQERTEGQDTGRDSSRSSESDESEPSGTSGSGGGGLTDAVSSVTGGLLNH